MRKPAWSNEEAVFAYAVANWKRQHRGEFFIRYAESQSVDNAMRAAEGGNFKKLARLVEDPECHADLPLAAWRMVADRLRGKVARRGRQKMTDLEKATKYPIHGAAAAARDISAFLRAKYPNEKGKVVRSRAVECAAAMFKMTPDQVAARVNRSRKSKK
jgi:hypothetical protein